MSEREPYGYPVGSGFIGYIDGEKRLYSTEDDYNEIIFDLNEKEEN